MPDLATICPHCREDLGGHSKPIGGRGMTDLDVIRSALDHCTPGTLVTSDSIRDAIDAAQIRPSLIGPLMGHAVRLGWLRPTGRWQYSARRSRKHSRISEYRVAPSTNWRK